MQHYKKSIIVSVVSIIAAIGIAAMCVIARQNRIKNEQLMNAEDVKRASKITALNASRTAEADRISKLGFYQKLKEGDRVSILIIGDDIGESDGSTKNNGWIDQLTNKLNTSYKSMFDVDKITQSGSTAVRSWIEYCRQSTTKKYDAVFIYDGLNDQNVITTKEFYMCYENLIWRLIQQNPHIAIFPIIENTINTTSTYCIDINQIAQYYGLDVINTKQAFSKSGKGIAELMNTDKVHPNDYGYGIYANEMYSIIAANVKNNKLLEYKQKKMSYSASDELSTFNFINTPKSLKGFTSDDKLFTSSSVGDSISFETKGSVTYIYYNTDQYGSKFSIYLNNYLVGTIDTTNSQLINASFLMPSSEAGTITIVVSSVRPKGKVSIQGIITNR